MNYLYKILVYPPLSIVVFLSSCNKTLDITPVSSISSISFFKTESDVRGANFGMYIKLRNETSFNSFALGELRGETVTMGLAGTGGYERYYQNTIDANVTTPLITWTGYYSVINAANLIIKYAPTATFSTEASRNDYLAQAYTMRAYIYFLMTRTWGDLPLRTEPLEEYNFQAVQIARSPKAEIFSLIKSDINQALQLFPANTFQAGRNVWSKPSANALKADIYLWTAKRMNGGVADFTTALEACNAVQTAYLPTTETAGRTAVGQLGGNNIWSPSALVRNQFTMDDQRRNATFTEVYNVNATTGARTLFGAVINKGDGTVIGGTRFYADDIILYRYADVLLLKAEAKNGLGQDPSPEINLVRQRAYGTAFSAHTFINGSKDANDAAILQERLFELAYEGKRWWDLVRFGKAFDLVPSLQNRRQEHLLLHPVNAITLSLEPKVMQNPGYQ